MNLEHYITFAVVCIGITSLGLFGVIKACDWLIGLKYISKDDYKSEIEDFSKDLTKKFATIESHNYLKEDINEIKSKIDDIHDVIMTFAVESCKRKDK